MKEVLKLARKALETSKIYCSRALHKEFVAPECRDAIREIDLVLAQQSDSVSNEQVEPVAYRYMDITEPDLGFWFDEEPSDLSYLKCEPLYTHPTVPTAQPKEPEQGPVAWESILGAVARGWCYEENANKTMDSELAVAITKEVQALYTIPPQRKPLTDEQMDAVIDGCPKYHGRFSTKDPDGKLNYYELIRAIEAAHGIKE